MFEPLTMLDGTFVDEARMLDAAYAAAGGGVIVAIIVIIAPM